MADCPHDRVQTVRACSLRREGPGRPPIVQATCLDCGASASTLTRGSTGDAGAHDVRGEQVGQDLSGSRGVAET